MAGESYKYALNALIERQFRVNVAPSWEPLTFLISKDNGNTYTEVSATSDILDTGDKCWIVTCDDGDYVKLVRGGTAPS